MVIRKANKNNNKLYLIIVLCLCILFLGIFMWQHNSRLPKDLSKSKSVGQNTKGELPDDNTEPDTPESRGDVLRNDKKGSEDALYQNVIVKEPTGNFVSSHIVQMNSKVASSCVTAPGVKCYIQFTKSGISRSLKEQNTDKEGSTFWEWTPQQIGLSTGDWQVKAIATNGSETKSATDAAIFKVEQ